MRRVGLQGADGSNHTASEGPDAAAHTLKSPGSVVRGLRILERLSRAGRGITLTELSRSLDSPKSTTLKLLRTLQEGRFVSYSKQSKTYLLGPGALALAELILDSPRLRLVCRPYLERLSEVSSEDAYLGVKENSYIVYIDKVEGRQSVRLDIALGTRRHLHSSAVGKLFLAEMGEEALRSTVEAGELTAITFSTMTDPEVLLEDLERIRREGVSVSRGENVEGITAIAAPIRDHDGSVAAGISVSGPSARLNDSLEDLIKLVKSTARSITEDLQRSEIGESPDDLVSP